MLLLKTHCFFLILQNTILKCLNYFFYYLIKRPNPNPSISNKFEDWGFKIHLYKWWTGNSFFPIFTYKCCLYYSLDKHWHPFLPCQKCMSSNKNRPVFITLHCIVGLFGFFIFVWIVPVSVPESPLNFDLVQDNKENQQMPLF